MNADAIRLDKRINITNLIDAVKPCTLTFTTNSIYVDSKHHGKYVYCDNGVRLHNREISYVSQFRRYFEKNAEHLEYDKTFLKWKRAYVKYFIESGKFDDVIEIDINNAYPTAGKILGIIPEKLYERGKSLSKFAMLVSIGSLHRQKRIVKVYADGKRKLITKEEKIGRAHV